MNMASMPNEDHRRILNTLFILWSTPLRAVEKGAIVDVEFAETAIVVLAKSLAAALSRETSFSLSGAMISVYFESLVFVMTYSRFVAESRR
jgi:hypothetical protein